jgi:hypothetical protein
MRTPQHAQEHGADRRAPANGGVASVAASKLERMGLREGLKRLFRVLIWGKVRMGVGFHGCTGMPLT